MCWVTLLDQNGEAKTIHSIYAVTKCLNLPAGSFTIQERTNTNVCGPQKKIGHPTNRSKSVLPLWIRRYAFEATMEHCRLSFSCIVIIPCSNFFVLLQIGEKQHNEILVDRDSNHLQFSITEIMLILAAATNLRRGYIIRKLLLPSI